MIIKPQKNSSQFMVNLSISLYDKALRVYPHHCIRYILANTSQPLCEWL